MPYLVVSPHLDDAALSCGWLLAAYPGSIVATLFTAPPADASLLTAWDRECGFDSSVAAMRERLKEDQRFADAVGAELIWLDLLDGQYQRYESRFEAALAALLKLFKAQPEHELLIPIGLSHPDHLLCHRAALAAWQQLQWPRPLQLYEDSPYRGVGDVLRSRRRQLQDDGLELGQRTETKGCPQQKSALLQHYGSQWRRLAADQVLDLDDCLQPEGLWQCRVASA